MIYQTSLRFGLDKKISEIGSEIFLQDVTCPSPLFRSCTEMILLKSGATMPEHGSVPLRFFCIRSKRWFSRPLCDPFFVKAAVNGGLRLYIKPSSLQCKLKKHVSINPKGAILSRECVHIIKRQLAYHQHLVLYIIKPQGTFYTRQSRDDMQGQLPLMIYTPKGVMICQTLRFG